MLRFLKAYWQQPGEERRGEALRRRWESYCRVDVVIPFLLAVTVVFALFAAMSESLALSHLEYTTVTGYFLQDDPTTYPADFDYSASAFGLIIQNYDTDKDFDPNYEKTQWERFAYKLQSLNDHADKHTEFKLFYMGRHGEGYHNVAEELYGTEAWDCYWSKLDGNGSITWSDARLTETGITQALHARATWAAQIQDHIPLPQSYYTSPLDRCLQTAKLTFNNLPLPPDRPFKPVVKELLRETLGVHTCDRRSPTTHITKTYPTYTLEPNFAPTDPLWDPNLRESNSARTARLRQLLNDIVEHNSGPSSTYISLTAHSGAITSLLEVVGHRAFRLETGGVIPVLVRIVRREGSRGGEVVEPSGKVPECREGLVAGEGEEGGRTELRN
ncbi:phosphoglycerate mutase [Blastomyces dermatitidis ER-3]|uniref:Phosphoglycerate mutase n=1 Tax=Ajellomyces dermatitidis (strain ER-3 / ATCC MYA-2586) TaxID=559297 RepID=A0ABX2VXZ8_AJEDR|nr:phosphoglycerate mutase [Blastomyces dermatitidis ER-3]OAT02027.1 phosphoglycerate mutase [Blastomyces dermatitidis ER-3]